VPPAAIKNLDLGRFARGGGEPIADQHLVGGIEEQRELAARVGKGGVSCPPWPTLSSASLLLKGGIAVSGLVC